MSLLLQSYGSDGTERVRETSVGFMQIAVLDNRLVKTDIL